MSCHHSRRKRTSSHGILKSQIPGFAFYHFISFQFIASAAHTPLAQFPYFVFHVFPLETINQCHPQHTQTLRGFLLTLSCLDPPLNISLGVFRPCGHFFFSIPGFGFCWALGTRGFVHVGVLSLHDLFLQHLHWALPQGPPPSQWASLPPLKTLAYLLGWLQWPKITKKYWKHKPHSSATI